MDWERVNVWTSTLYTLIHSVSAARAQKFHPLSDLDSHATLAKTWIGLNRFAVVRTSRHR